MRGRASRLSTDLPSNLPVGVLAIVVLFFFLNTPPRERKTVRQQAADFDFTGLFLIVPASGQAEAHADRLAA